MIRFKCILPAAAAIILVAAAAKGSQAVRHMDGNNGNSIAAGTSGSPYEKGIQIECSDSIDCNGVFVRFGGYGSDLDYSEKDSLFWILTDRGPNVDGPVTGSKIFPYPDFCPNVGKFKMENGTLRLVGKIELKDKNGEKMNGLPDKGYKGDDIETAFDIKGNMLSNKSRGIDPEGLAICPDGSFYISDEYGPFILHFDRHGRLIEEYSPYNGKLPGFISHRQLNRGMEGLTINNEGTILYGIIQSPLDENEETVEYCDNKSVPIIMIDLAKKEWNTVNYRLESPENMVSAITYVNDSTLYVLERDGNFPNAGNGMKKVFAATIKPDSIHVAKRLLADIIESVPSYWHDKTEGMCLLNDSTLCIVNDDDFGIIGTEAPKRPSGISQSWNPVSAKKSPDGRTDINEMYFIRIESAKGH